VDDERKIADIARDYLQHAGYSVLTASAGDDALALARSRQPDLVVLDLRLPHMDGIEVARTLRRESSVPIIMLTARAEESDRLLGLDVGADDYMTKPFSPRELVARVGAVMRRVRPALAGEQLGYADIEMDISSHRVRRGGEPIALGPTEFRLLRHFLEHPGRVFSRERLLEAVWSHDPDIDARTVDVHVRRLRQALNTGNRSDLIRTVRSAGYSLDVDG